MLIYVACGNGQISVILEPQTKEVFVMLNENIKAIRKSKGISQEELAVKLNVVRQTISKWEKGLSVPDCEMLVVISEVLQTPVSTLLGETITTQREDELKVISEKLEVINLQLSQISTKKRKLIRLILICVCVAILATFVILYFLSSSYLGWDYSKPDLAVAGTILHGFEWLFIRIAPLALIGAVVGIILTYKKS